MEDELGSRALLLRGSLLARTERNKIPTVVDPRAIQPTDHSAPRTTMPSDAPDMTGPTEEQIDEVRIEMVGFGQQLRDLIANQPPQSLLGYIHAQRYLHEASGGKDDPKEPYGDHINQQQFLLEYVHAVLATTPDRAVRALDEAECATIFDVSKRLYAAAVSYAMATSMGTKDGAFGSETGMVEFHTKSAWVNLRGNRYQVLEGEFYEFVLAPHDDILREIYGIGSKEIAEGFQRIADSHRAGQANSFDTLTRTFERAKAFAAERGGSTKDAAEEWHATHDDLATEAGLAFMDGFNGGICNVSRHSGLPDELLSDLSFNRGEDDEFYSPDPLSGTPFRTLPARKRPLIRLSDGHYAPDPCFVRDAGYRALLFNLLQRRPDYKKTFADRQKEMSELAFARIFDRQLRGGTVWQEFYYKNPDTNEWVENDLLIVIGDVLIQVEAKAGAAATIASPATDFDRHAQSVTDLIIKAYNQCARFVRYLQSADQVPICVREGGKYVEVARLRAVDYRLVVPIGLTVESFSPFSAMSKTIPGLEPIRGHTPFLSMSIDDLFVLARVLPTMGAFAHYLEVRQATAAIKEVFLYDEFDHLGVYVRKNRMDADFRAEITAANANMMMTDGGSDIIDEHFANEDWESRPLPRQEMHAELEAVLQLLDTTRPSSWLVADRAIREYDAVSRRTLGSTLRDLRLSLARHPRRHGYMRPLSFWVARLGTVLDPTEVETKACAAAMAVGQGKAIVLKLSVDQGGAYIAAAVEQVRVPPSADPRWPEIKVEADRLRGRMQPLPSLKATKQQVQKTGRNEPCPCGSGRKFKRCHGAV